MSLRGLAAMMTALEGQRFGLYRAGGIGLLGTIIRAVHALRPRLDAPFPVWQGMQYLRDMSSGRGRFEPLDNDRYGSMSWTSSFLHLQREPAHPATHVGMFPARSGAGRA